MQVVRAVTLILLAFALVASLSGSDFAPPGPSATQLWAVSPDPGQNPGSGDPWGAFWDPLSLPRVWHGYAYHTGTFVPLGSFPQARINVPGSIEVDPPDPSACPLANLSLSWHIRAATQADLTRDGIPECVLLVWRPWRDWPIMKWSDTPSPIAANRDAQGDSAHIILVEAQPTERGYRELWAGSALVVPIVQLATGDVDGDGWDELVVLEGDYDSGRDGPARHVAVWRWNGFGFTLDWRSPPGRLVALALSDLDGNEIFEILVR